VSGEHGSPSWERSPSSAATGKRSQAAAIRRRSAVGKSTTTPPYCSRQPSIPACRPGRVLDDLGRGILNHERGGVLKITWKTGSLDHTFHQ
jgi:hypothetical protein